MRHDRNKKAQLGARVPPEVRQAALEAAQRDGVSLNVWIESLIRERVSIAQPVIEGQTAIAVPAVNVKRFDSECRNAGYHWMNGAGNPCRFCGGEG